MLPLQATQCHSCRQLVVQLLITECAHLLCPSCVASNMTECAACTHPIEHALFKRLQLNFRTGWDFEVLPGWTPPSKASNIIATLDECRAAAAGTTAVAAAASTSALPLKAIVFSQYSDVLTQVDNALLQYYGGWPNEDWAETGAQHVAAFRGSREQREEALQLFQHDPDCFVILLSKDGEYCAVAVVLLYCTIVQYLHERSISVLLPQCHCSLFTVSMCTLLAADKFKL
jgi:SNF2 family DNA or RNA helicase